jgi:4-amino-4-deoxy-L-arabinose transferase-like glycosyltransferase
LRFGAFAVVVTTVAVLRILSTYLVFNHTIDEPTHILCGLEWLKDHTYTIELQHPPLARIAAAVGPFLVGAHSPPKQELATKGPLVLYDSPSYYRTLATARAGELPFFVLASSIVWVWARRLHGPFTALLSVVLFTTLPPVMAHAGLATTDMAIGATLPAAVYAFVRWLEDSDWKRSIALGLAVALGLLSKFTFILFFPVCVIAVLFLQHWSFGRSLTGAAIAVGTAFLLIWAVYGFRITPVPTAEGPGGMISILPGPLKTAVLRHPSIPVPAGEVYMGIVEARAHNYYGHLTYLLGQRSTSGWWYFFPVVLAHKTPLAFLLLSLAACVWLRRAPREHWIPLACAMAILLSVLPSRIDLGIRHILPMYPLLAIPAGLAAARLLQSGSRIRIGIAAVLLCWQIAASALSHPDYIAYFNELSLGEPEYVRVDSDLDWGQSVDRLVGWQRQQRPQVQIGFAGFGSTNPTWHGLDYYPVSPWHRSSGWIAVSATERMLSESKPPLGATSREPWSWLDAYDPVVRLAGSSILIYNIPARP